jgi:hypothetical protein
MKLVLSAKAAGLVEEAAAVDMVVAMAAEAVAGAVATVGAAGAAGVAGAGIVVTAVDMEAGVADEIAN